MDDDAYMFDVNFWRQRELEYYDKASRAYDRKIKEALLATAHEFAGRARRLKEQKSASAASVAGPITYRLVSSIGNN
jgi:hypothetical protein